MKPVYKNLNQEILKGIKKNGGWVNTHAHIDRAFTLINNNIAYVNKTLQEKWFLNDELKKRSTVIQIYDRMAYTVEYMISQGVQALGTFIDVDEVIKDKAIQAAVKIRNRYKKEIQIRFINQTLKGVIDKEARKWFDEGSAFVDIIGGLPGKDKGHEKEHLEIVLETARKMKKMAHLHVDQLNTQKEKETELLCQKTIEGGMQGKVVAIHGVSIAAHPIFYRKKLYKLMKKAQVKLISCPSAWIDSRRTEELAVSHNAIAPVEELVSHDITVGLGTDNICDIYKPFSDGNMWTELRFLLESCHFYEIKELIRIGSTNGLKILGIQK